MATPRKTTTKASTKTVAEKPVETEEIVEEVKIPEQPKEFAPTDRIPCRSVTAGTLLYNGIKSRLPQIWASHGDLSQVEYQDLVAAMMTRSDYIFDPLFIIEDEDLLKAPEWSEVAELYEDIYKGEDLDAIINLPVPKFRTTFTSLPLGVKNAIKIAVATKINDGEFDSLKKVQIIDEVCGSDLQCLIH